MKRSSFIKSLIGLPFVAPLLAEVKPAPEDVLVCGQPWPKSNVVYYKPMTMDDFKWLCHELQKEKPPKHYHNF